MFLLPSKCKRKSAKAHTCYCDFSEACEKRTKNMKNRTLKACISMIVGQIQLKFGMECVLPPHNKKWCSSIQALSSYRCVNTVFSWFLYNTHLSVVCPHWLYLASWFSVYSITTQVCSPTDVKKTNLHSQHSCYTKGTYLKIYFGFQLWWHKWSKVKVLCLAK